MTRFGLTVVLLWSLLSIPTAHAEGMLRRLPNVGEYAVYDTVLVVTSGGNEDLDIPELTGTLTLQCVGIEEIDKEPHYWLEFLLVLENHEVPMQFTTKLLVSESQIQEGDPVENFARGWYLDSLISEPISLEHGHMEIASDPMPLWARAVFRGAKGDAEILEQAQTVTFGDQTLRIATAEHGNFEPDELLDDADLPNPITGWGTWWLHDDVAFGVAATEQLWTIEVPEIGTIDFAIQCTLKEVGNDAVSALPDHN